MPDSLSLLRESAFRNFFIGRTISAFGSSLSPLALAFGVLAIGGSATDLGLVIGAATVPQLLLVLFGGVIGDRFERRRILLASDVAMGVLQAVTALLLLTNHAHVWQLMLLQFGRGCASAFFGPASTGAIRDFVGAAQVQRAQSLLGISRSTTGIVGPAVAGVIVAIGNPGIALAFDAATFFVSAFALSRIRVPLAAVSLGSSIRADVVQGWREFASRTWVWVFVVSAGVYQATVLPTIGVLGPVFAQEALGGAAAWATILVARSVGSLLAGVVMLHWRPNRPMFTAILLLFLDLPFLLLMGMQHVSVFWLSAAGIVAGMAVPMCDTLWFAALAENVPEEAQSRVSSYDWLGSLAMAPLGYALIGGVSNTVGLQATVLGVVLVHIVVDLGVIAVPSIRNLRRGQPA